MLAGNMEWKDIYFKVAAENIKPLHILSGGRNLHILG
jgi:hypothetical protein